MYLYFLNLIFFFVIRPKTPQPIELSSCAWCALGSFPWRLPHLVSSALVLFPHGAAKREIRIFFYFERERLFGVILSMARWWLEAQTCIHNLYKSCGEPSLLDQCAQYKFGPGVICTIKIAHRRTLLDGLWQLWVDAWRRGKLNWTTVAFFHTQREPLVLTEEVFFLLHNDICIQMSVM